VINVKGFSCLCIVITVTKVYVNIKFCKEKNILTYKLESIQNFIAGFFGKILIFIFLLSTLNEVI
jgi:hypothetical protein